MPNYCNNKSVSQNLKVIETAVCLIKLGVASLKDIKAYVTVFDLLARKYASN